MAKLPNILKYIMWPLRIIVVLAVVLFLLLLGGTWWLATEDGKSYVNNLIKTELSDSIGYDVLAEGISLQFPLTATVAKLSVADKDGIWLEANNIAVHLIPTPTIQEHLIIRKIAMDSLKLFRVPNPINVESSGEKSNMAVSLLGSEIKQITLAKAITGLEDDAVLSLEASADINPLLDQIALKAKSHIQSGVPEVRGGDVLVNVEYNTKTSLVKISEAKLAHQNFEISSEGNINLVNNELNVALKSSSLDIAKWIKNVSGKADIDAQITGTIEKPNLVSTIKSSGVIYKEKPIPDAITQITAVKNKEEISGALNVQSPDVGDLKTDYKWASPNLKLENIIANYLKNSATGNVELNTDSMLASGKIEAKIPAIEDFAEYLPQPVSGKANIIATLTVKNDKQALAAIADVQNLEVQNTKIQTLHAEANFSDIQTAMPDSVKANLTNAKYENIAVNKATVTATNKDKIWNANLAADGNANQPFNIKTAATISEKKQNWKAVFSSLIGTYGKTTFNSADKITVDYSAAKQALSAPKLRINNSSFAIDATKDSKAISANASASNIALADFIADTPKQLQNSRAGFTLKISGAPASPVADLKIDVTGIKLHDGLKDSSIKATAKVEKGQAVIAAITNDSTGLRSNLNATIPVIFSIDPFAVSVVEKSPLKANADFAFDISALADIFLPPEQVLKGKADGKLAVTGTVEKPLISGTVKFTDGSYSYLPLGVNLQKIGATITANNRSFNLSQFYAEDVNGKPLNATGNADLTSMESFAYNLKVNMKKLALINHQNAHATISGDISMKGSNSDSMLSGDLISDELTINIPEQFASTVPQLNVVETIPHAKQLKPKDPQTSSPIKLDIKWQADNKVFVRGRGVDAELKGNLAVTGDATNPEIVGKLTTIRGRYEEFGKKFKLKTAELIFEGDIPPSPFLNIVASSTVDGTEIMPTISGPVLEPALTIESTPTLPEDEALSLLLFGKDPTKISPVQAGQLAQSLAKLSGRAGSGFDPLGKARDLLGLDDLKVNSGNTAADTSVGVGKYIGDNIYLEIERGAESSSSKARVEVEVTPSISVESSTGATGDSNVGVNWKHDY